MRLRTVRSLYRAFKPQGCKFLLYTGAAGRQWVIETIEGLESPEKLHPIQQAYIEEGAVQCGFCTPGMIMYHKALLDQVPNPDTSQIRSALSGNICRCTGYTKIEAAVKNAARKLEEVSHESI